MGCSYYVCITLTCGLVLWLFDDGWAGIHRAAGRKLTVHLQTGMQLVRLSCKRHSGGVDGAHPTMTNQGQSAQGGGRLGEDGDEVGKDEGGDMI